MQKNIRKIDKVLGIRIQTICKTRTRGKISIRVLPFFYLTIASFFYFFKHFEGFSDRRRMAFSRLYENGENCVALRA